MSDDISGVHRSATPSVSPAAPPPDDTAPTGGASRSGDAPHKAKAPGEVPATDAAEPPNGERPAARSAAREQAPTRPETSAPGEDPADEAPAQEKSAHDLSSGEPPAQDPADDAAAPSDAGAEDDDAPGTGRVRAEADDPITAHTDAAAATQGPAAPQDEESPPDPLVDLEQRKREAGVDKTLPFGRPGQPLGRTHPFVFGFTGALGVICAWLLIQAVISARGVLVLIVVSMFLAVGLNPAVERLQRARLPRSGAVAVVFLGLVLAFVGAGFAVIPPLTEQITNFIDHLPAYIEQLGSNQRIQELDREYQVLQKAQEAVTNPNFGQSAIDGVLGVGRALAGGIFNTLTVLILTLYFLSSLPTIKTFFYRLAPRSRRARVALLGDEILLRIGGYVAGTLTVAFIAGTAAYVFLTIMEVPFALPLALFVGVTALIPLVGATIGATLACTVAFFDGMFTGIACVIFFVVYQQVENYIIHPRVMKRAVDVQPAVTIIAALIGGTLLGIVGALLAIPTAAALALIIREVIIPRQETL